MYVHGCTRFEVLERRAVVLATNKHLWTVSNIMNRKKCWFWLQINIFGLLVLSNKMNVI